MTRIPRTTAQDLGSMAQLRAQRDKLRWQIRSSEDVLEREYRHICSMFSFANIVRKAFSSIENIQALVSGVRDGYQSIASLFHKKKD